MDINLYVIEDYENETAFRLRENKPNQTQFQTPSAGLFDMSQDRICPDCLDFSICGFCCLLYFTLFALAVVILKQFSEVFVFSASRFKVENLVFDTYTQVIKRFLQAIDTLFKFFTVCLCLFGKLGQLSMLRGSCLSEFLDQFVKFVFQVCFVHHMISSQMHLLYQITLHSPILINIAKPIPKRFKSGFSPNLTCIPEKQPIRGTFCVALKFCFSFPKNSRYKG